jgi:DnaJ-class molecular chaperone
MADGFDPYAVLGVSASATLAEITHAYRQQLHAQHPDTRRTPAGAAPAADEQLQRLLAAYAILRDPARRAAYDRTAPATTKPRSVITTPGSRQGIDIPITRTESAQRPPLWVGPVRRHR